MQVTCNTCYTGLPAPRVMLSIAGNQKILQKQSKYIPKTSFWRLRISTLIAFIFYFADGRQGTYAAEATAAAAAAAAASDVDFPSSGLQNRGYKKTRRREDEKTYNDMWMCAFVGVCLRVWVRIYSSIWNCVGACGHVVWSVFLLRNNIVFSKTINFWT